MKKFIGILGIMAIATSMFFNNETMNSSNEDLELTSLVTMNTANAECQEWSWPMKCNAFDRCSQFGSGPGCDVR